MCVDDAQWIDTASLEALGFAARRLGGDRVGDAHRVPRRGRAELPRRRASSTSHWPGSRADAIAALVDRAAERPLSHNLRDRLARATHGNPLAALEVAAAVSDDRLAGRIGVGEPLPPSRLISHAFEQRIGALSEPARHALLLAAAGESESAHVCSPPPARLELPPDAFAEAERAGAIAVEDDRVRFRHPLLRSLAYRGAPAEQRRRAHGALAGCLTAAPGTESERRAWHLAAAARGARRGRSRARSPPRQSASRTAPATSPPPTPTSAPPS